LLPAHPVRRGARLDWRQLNLQLDAGSERDRESRNCRNFGARIDAALNVPANAPHVFRTASDRPARLLCLCSPAGQEGFFKEVGVPVAHRTESPPALDDAATGAFIAKAIALAPKYRRSISGATLPSNGSCSRR
jgi:hypothetical protein